MTPKKQTFFSSPKRRENFWLSCLMLAPTAIILGLVSVYPLISSFDISLRKYNLMKPGDGFGYNNFANYQFIFADPKFWQSLRVTAVFVVLNVSLVMILSLAIALLLNREFRGRNFVRVIMLIPWAVPYVVNGLMWVWILNPSFGALNGLLTQLGWIKSYVVWLGDKNLAMFMVVCAEAWKEIPFIMLMLLAALSTIPKDLYEAATVDGANAVQRFFLVTIPMIRPTLFVALTLRTIWAVKSFDLIYTLTAGGPAGATSVLGYYTYLKSFVQLNLGRGSAAAWVMTLIMMMLTYFYQRALNTDQE